GGCRPAASPGTGTPIPVRRRRGQQMFRPPPPLAGEGWVGAALPRDPGPAIPARRPAPMVATATCRPRRLPLAYVRGFHRDPGKPMAEKSWKPEALAVYGGYRPDPRSSAVAVPIDQTVAYAFDNSQHGADLFDLKVPGNIYARI